MLAPHERSIMPPATVKNQERIIAIEKRILRNQQRLDTVIRNQREILRTLEAVIKNQKKILDSQRRSRSA